VFKDRFCLIRMLQNKKYYTVYTWYILVFIPQITDKELMLHMYIRCFWRANLITAPYFKFMYLVVSRSVVTSSIFLPPPFLPSFPDVLSSHILGLLAFWTLPIARYSKEHSISEIGSDCVLWWVGEGTCSVEFIRNSEPQLRPVTWGWLFLTDATK
jgi:hypothetical protein